MADPSLIKEIKQALSIPIMAKARVGHFVEAQILEQIGVDYIDESEELRIADENHFMNKHNFGVKFVCGCRDLGEALRWVREGSAMIRTQGEIKGFGELFVIPECSPELKPVVGQKFQTLDFGFAFYDVYARAVGFGTLYAQ
ncbi:pyridoxal 5'-phosphate synthase subunit PDX1.3-like [Salvia hispanica]|uniref:pyridoxal 5'-phosphate synthase subunit PDX1.3-like n=1 Tax=Salvia hispanica TaxID=49212 RepID=UPI002009D06F|nr:pyridoxal 5'-phosphate synthase subunit PDX1.3-like [Salvia hispanica]